MKLAGAELAILLLKAAIRTLQRHRRRRSGRVQAYAVSPGVDHLPCTAWLNGPGRETQAQVYAREAPWNCLCAVWDTAAGLRLW